MADMSGTAKLVRQHAVSLMDFAMREVVDETARAAPVKTGDLRRSVSMEGGVIDGPSGPTAVIVADTPYAEFVDKGTAPHIIRAKGSGVLVFPWPKVGPGLFYFKQVNHPGTKANPFFSEPMGERFRMALESAVFQVTTVGV